MNSVIAEIRRLQAKGPELLIPKRAFSRLVAEVFSDIAASEAGLIMPPATSPSEPQR